MKNLSLAQYQKAGKVFGMPSDFVRTWANLNEILPAVAQRSVGTDVTAIAGYTGLAKPVVSKTLTYATRIGLIRNGTLVSNWRRFLAKSWATHFTGGAGNVRSIGTARQSRAA